MRIENYLLEGDKVSFKKTPNVSGEFKAGDLDTIIIHYTAGPFQPSLNTLTNPRAKASAHLIVGRDGRIAQLAPFNIMTWHAGRSYYKGRSGFNKYSIGIEIENDGSLKKSGNVYRAWYGATHKEEDVVKATHRNQRTAKYWHTYTQPQIELVTEICRQLVEAYDIKYILGHEEICPQNKQDPGPAFPLDDLRYRLLHNNRSEDGKPQKEEVVMRVAASKLNIRSQPSTNGSKVARPLAGGTKVKVLEQKHGWMRVKTEIEGWVFGKYLEKDS